MAAHASPGEGRLLVIVDRGEIDTALSPGLSMGIKAILTDIEGTITSLSFVKEVLFPYSKERMKDFITTLFNHTEFIIRIKDYEAHCTNGEPGYALMQAITDIAKQNDIKNGRIVGIKMLNNVKLKFSKDIPDRLHQK